jgi:hypothetical protein
MEKLRSFSSSDPDVFHAVQSIDGVTPFLFHPNEQINSIQKTSEIQGPWFLKAIQLYF